MDFSAAYCVFVWVLLIYCVLINITFKIFIKRACGTEFHSFAPFLTKLSFPAQNLVSSFQIFLLDGNVEKNNV